MKPTHQTGLREALLWQPLASGQNEVVCNLCAHRCQLRPDQLGICGVRINRAGTLFTRVYGLLTSQAIDPIEKKPLFHFHPQARTFSIATVGCNFTCLHCQNHPLSQHYKKKPASDVLPGEFIPAADVVEEAIYRRCEVIAYTYSEPTIFLEYALDVARLAKSRGLKNIFVTNGYMTEEATALLAPLLDAANVDLKGADDAMLRRETKSVSGPVRRTIEDLYRRGVWVEVTTLIIPGSNDDDAQLRQIAEFLVSISPDLPWHVSRFYPMYQMLDRQATPPSTLERAVRIGEQVGLRYVYTGNVPGDKHEHTHCPQCHQTVIERCGFSVGRIAMRNQKCDSCGSLIAGQGLP